MLVFGQQTVWGFGIPKSGGVSIGRAWFRSSRGPYWRKLWSWCQVGQWWRCLQWFADIIYRNLRRFHEPQKWWLVGAIWCTGEGINVLVVWDGVGILFFIMFNTSNSHHSRYEVDMVNSQHSRIGPRIWFIPFIEGQESDIQLTDAYGDCQGPILNEHDYWSVAWLALSHESWRLPTSFFRLWGFLGMYKGQFMLYYRRKFRSQTFDNMDSC